MRRCRRDDDETIGLRFSVLSLFCIHSEIFSFRGIFLF